MFHSLRKEFFMKIKNLLFVFVSVVALFSISCSDSDVFSVNSDDITISEGPYTVSSLVTLYEEKQNREDTLYNGLTKVDMVNFLNWKVKDVKFLVVYLYRNGSSDIFKLLTFPVVNGTCVIKFEIENGEYSMNTFAISNNDIRRVHFFAHNDFSADLNEEINLDIVLKTKETISTVVVFKNPVGTNYIEGEVSYESIENSPFNANELKKFVYSKALNHVTTTIDLKVMRTKAFVFKMNGNSMFVPFSILDIMTSDTLLLFPKTGVIDVNGNLIIKDKQSLKMEKNYPVDGVTSATLNVLNNGHLECQMSKKTEPGTAKIKVLDAHGKDILENQRYKNANFHIFNNLQGRLSFQLFNKYDLSKRYRFIGEMTYTVILDSVQDLFSDTLNKFSWSFTTGEDDLKPQIFDIFPSQDLKVLANRPDISVTFDEDVRFTAGTSEFVLLDEFGNQVTGSIQVNSGYIVKFTPLSDLKRSTSIMV